MAPDLHAAFKLFSGEQDSLVQDVCQVHDAVFACDAHPLQCLRHPVTNWGRRSSRPLRLHLLRGHMLCLQLNTRHCQLMNPSGNLLQGLTTGMEGFLCVPPSATQGEGYK